MKIIQCLNGKKTMIGLSVSLVVFYLSVKQVIDSETATLLLSLSAIFTGVGVAHKVGKHKKEKE